MVVNVEKYDDIKNALDESSNLNRRFLLSFLLFEVYMLVIVGSTSDMQFLVDSKIRLPLANVDIPLFGFYIIAPIFMIAFHFNLLFNILQHSQKLFYWSEKVKSSEKKVLLQPFLFNFLVRFSPGQINYYLLRTILYSIICFFPLSLLVLTQLKFSKYHSFPMTCWHFVLVLIDVLLLLIYWPRIINPKLSDEQSEKLEGLFKDQILPILCLLWKGIKKIVALSISFAVVIWGAESLKQIRGFGGDIIFVKHSSFFAFTYLLVLAFNWKRIWAENLWKNIWLITWKTILLVPLWKICWSILLFLFKFIKLPKSFIKSFQEKFSFTSFSLANWKKTNLRDIFLASIIATSFANFLLICSLAVGCFPSNKFFKVIYPRLTVTEKTLVAKGPSDTIIRYYLDQKKDKESDWLNFTQGLNLEHRDLRFANFMRSKLFKANLKSARLQGANLEYAEMQGANLVYAKLQGAKLRYAEMQGANLEYAEMQGADLGAAKLQEAKLVYAKLQGAKLRYAKLQGANLVYAKLQGANLVYAEMHGAKLEYAAMQETDLEYAEMHGAGLEPANLQGIWGKVDLITTINWDELAETVSDRIGRTEARKSILQRIELAKKRCEKFDKSATSKALTSNINFEQFLAERIEFACISEHVARGIIVQHQWYMEKKIIEDQRKYMSKKCPKISNKIDWE